MAREYLVSAIVSTYNSEAFIRGALEDLETQTISDRLEIIVVDSGSEQNEEAVVREFQVRYSNIRYLRTPERETIYAAWNRGVRLASGRFLTNANTDDRHRSDALEVLARGLDRRPELGLVWADSLITAVPNETFERNSAESALRWPDFSIRQMLSFSIFGPQPMWRHSVHKSLGCFDPTYVVAGDYEFFSRVAWKFGAHHLSETLGLYYQGPGIEHSNQARCAEETRRILAKYRTAVPIEDVYAGLAEAANPRAARGLAYLDFANTLMIGPHPDPALAERCYRIALEELGREPAVLNNLGLVCHRLGRVGESLTLLQEAADRGEPIAEANRRSIDESREGGPNLALVAVQDPLTDSLYPLVTGSPVRKL